METVYMRRSALLKIVLFGLLSGGLFILPWPCDAEIYKYQKNGTWVYTDTPPENMPTDHQKLKESKPADPATAPQRSLLVDYPWANAIEKAAAGTVYIETALGSGSGFFISSNGHILTNKHVIRSTSQQADQTNKRYRQMQEQITTAAENLSVEKNRIQKYKIQVDQLKKVAETESNAVRKDVYQANYEAKQTTYQQWLDDYNHRKDEFESKKKEFDSHRSKYEYAQSVTNLSQSFTVILADKQRFYARVIAVSPIHDLALLKLDGYRTPALIPVAGQAIAQGDPVYAIGNPVILKNSVTAGVFSGRENGFIKTNAHIYPGNSGGPLISQTGHVIGINTFKRLTHKFEGLGFAIPIQRALEAFGTHLP